MAFDVGSDDVLGLTGRHFDATNLRCYLINIFACLSRISSLSSRLMLHSPDNHRPVFDWCNFFSTWWCFQLSIVSLSYVLRQFGLVSVAFSAEWLDVIVLTRYEDVAGRTYIDCMLALFLLLPCMHYFITNNSNLMHIYVFVFLTQILPTQLFFSRLNCYNLKRVCARNVVNQISSYYVLCLLLFCFGVDLFMTITTPQRKYIYIHIYSFILSSYLSTVDSIT